ncbi:MAG TPA: ShlB/FhaC/HecB family hemolysin secretion/activation protein [Nitrospiraceae bacterium]|nr:ShlB/FhaC/HecB family hemolysin secretion/activation protein [Nitrospiraceae bacterium]
MRGNRIEQGTEEEHDESYLAWPLSEGLSGQLRTGGRSNLRTLLCLVLAMLLQAGIVSTVAAQVGVPLPPRPPQLPDAPPPPRPPELDVPPPPPKAPPEESITAPRIFVKEVRFTGNSAFTAEQLSAVTAPYMNRELTAEDLEALRLGLTYFYINRGYVTSGALIPEQTVTDGVLTMQIVEGQLTEINVEGANWFRPSYFQNRIRLAAGPPLNVNELQQRLQILQGDPRIKRINAELRPGLSRGDNTLNVNITEANPLKAWLEFNNYQSPTVGAEQGFVTVAHQNLLGFGDQLSLQYGRSAGVNPMLNFRYAIPVTARDTTVSFQYRRFDFTVTEDPFEELDIENNAEIFSLAVRHPVYRTLDQEFALSFGLDHEQNKSFLGGQPFEFIQGAPDGRFRITALRFGQEYTKRSSNQVIAALSRFSVGIGALDATTNGDPTLPDARFFSWLGQAQWIRQLPWWRTQLVTRGVVQLSNDHLFPLEQIAVGGRYSVRGYREFTLIRDNAAMASIEARVPVYTNRAGIDTLFIAPFFDVGHGWETTVATPDTPPATLASVGVGAIWNFWRGSHFEIYWGHQLKEFDTGRGNLQDHGIHLQLVVEAF